MRAFLRRRCWWLFLGAVGLATLAIGPPILVLDLKRSAAFDHVQVGMKYLQAHRILMDAGAEEGWVESASKTPGVFGPVCPAWHIWSYPQIETHTVRHASAYRLGNDFVEIVWDKDGHVYDKWRTRIGLSWPDRVLAWLAPIRATMGL